MSEVRIPAFAKINLRLDILGKRADTYHELRTIFQTLSLHDEIWLKTSRQPGITLTIQGNASLAAAPLGADVPFFLLGGRALGVNRGDEIYPLQDILKMHVLVVVPQGIRVATPDAFRWVNAKPLGLTKSAVDPKLIQFCALSWSAQGSGLSNDFEGPVFRRHPRLDQIKRALLQKGATEASLAGSGSAVFGIFPSPAMARRAAVGFPHDQTFVCETLSRERYARRMRIAE